MLGAVLACGGGEPRSLILVSIDTLRADQLGCYGAERPTSPNLDRLAREGVLFERVLATSSWTLPSHASLFTGLYASRHGARSGSTKLRSDVPTLATLLHRQGFDTAAVVNNGLLTNSYGMQRGFAQHVDVPSDQSAPGAARRVSDHALRWLASRAGRPVFLFVHYYDLHSDYRSLPRFERLFTERRSPDEGSTRQLSRIIKGELEFEESDARQLMALYDAGIRQLDEELGRFLEELERLGRLDDSFLVVTSDHGEEFRDHGRVSHGRTLYQEQLRVALILRGPGIPRGRRVATPVSLVDVLPTALALLGVERPADLDGRDVRELWQDDNGPTPPERALFAGAAVADGEGLRAVVRGEQKLILDTRTGTAELYDLSEDPGEQSDRSQADGETLRSLTAELERLPVREESPGEPVQLDDDVRARLRILGYEVE